MGPGVGSSSNCIKIGGGKWSGGEMGCRHRVAADALHLTKHSFREIKRQLNMQTTVINSQNQSNQSNQLLEFPESIQFPKFLEMLE